MAIRRAAEVFAPGEFLRDVLEERGWSQVEFAGIIGRPSRLVNEIIAGKRTVTADTAMELAAALDTSPEYWLALEAIYQLSKVPEADDRIAREARLRERFPVREMARRGWISPSKSLDDIEASILGYFAISSLDEPIPLAHAARRNYREDLSTLQMAWIFRVKQLASALSVPAYSERKLVESKAELELLMTEPEEIRHIPEILSKCGVRLVIVEPIPGSKIEGVCFWINDSKSPVIGLSLKGDMIDKFWFNLWHEIEHVIRGDGKGSICIDNFDKDSDIESEEEKAANLAAANSCVPIKQIHSFIARHDPMYSEQSLIGFSRLMNRHPGIVAGQLQRKLDRWTLFKKYQVRVREIITAAAITDGYGRTGPSDM